MSTIGNGETNSVESAAIVTGQSAEMTVDLWAAPAVPGTSGLTAIPSGAVLLREAVWEGLVTGPTTATTVAQVRERVMARPVATCRRLSECVLTGAMEMCALIPVSEDMIPI